MSLPRDLRLARGPNGRFVAQAFVPELQTLRRAHTQLRSLKLLQGDTMMLPQTAFGPQLEIFATFKFPSVIPAAADTNASFGLIVLASNGSSSEQPERTVVRFDLQRQMVLLDRTKSGASLDADVRAGPLPVPQPKVNNGQQPHTKADDGQQTKANNGHQLSIHVYVDHTVVSLIVANETAISAWVAPTRAESVGVGAFSDLGGGGEVELDIDVWQLATPSHSDLD